jgi:hypothetical protein
MGRFIYHRMAENVILVSSEPDPGGASCIVHLREVSGIEASIDLINGIPGKHLAMMEVDATGKRIDNPVNRIGPLESRFYRIFFKQ